MFNNCGRKKWRKAQRREDSGVKILIKVKQVKYQRFCFPSYSGGFFSSEYEEDFEADEGKQDEKANEEGQADDQMNGTSESPSDDEKDHLAPEKESETLSREAADADDNVKDEGDGCSDSELEEGKQGKLFPDHVTCAVQQGCSLVFFSLYLMGWSSFRPGSLTSGRWSIGLP